MVAALTDLVQRILITVGVPASEAAVVAADLVKADQQNRGSHGVMMLSNYVGRIRGGSVRSRSHHSIVHDFGAISVLDAHNSLGQITARVAMESAIAKAKQFGLAAITVKNAFHLGVSGNYVGEAAAAGMIALVTTNTRPLMPAPGGAEAVVGNNPIAFGAPRIDSYPVVVDLALSEAAMGKIRLAAAQNQKIPNDWATDSGGRATDDPHAAIAGMLLPSGGAKGYGLAIMADILSGALSDGGFGQHVNGLFGDLTIPYNCSAFFLCLDPAAFGDRAAANIEEIAQRIENSRLQDPNQKIYLPGQRSEEFRRGNLDELTLPGEIAAGLFDVAKSLGVDCDPSAVAGAAQHENSREKKVEDLS